MKLYQKNETSMDDNGIYIHQNPQVKNDNIGLKSGIHDCLISE